MQMQKKLSIYTFLLLCLNFITINQGHAEEFAGKLVSSEGTVLFGSPSFSVVEI